MTVSLGKITGQASATVPGRTTIFWAKYTRSTNFLEVQDQEFTKQATEKPCKARAQVYHEEKKLEFEQVCHATVSDKNNTLLSYAQDT